MLNIYADFLENVLAMPVVKGRKTDKEKFNGAEETYTVECMMHDKKALQSGTSHYFGDGFAKAFDITFTGKDNQLHHPHQTSWGVSTRMIGGIIMTHGDNNGLVLPPRIAPIQAMVIPVAQHKEGVIEAATALLERLQAAGIRAKMDASEQSMGWKAAEYEMKGIPLRVEIGPKDIEKNQCVLVRRDNGEKIFISLDELETIAQTTLDAIHDGLYARAKKNLEDHTFVATSLEEAKQIQEEKGGFIKTMWCGELDCELKMKEEAGMTSRCMPLEQEHLADTCPICGRAAKKMIYWGVAY
jgi:prolyl-tRNA synthetase